MAGCAHFLTEYTTLPFVLGVILCGSVSRDIPPMIFIERSDSLPGVYTYFFCFQGEHSVLFAVPEEAAVLWEGKRLS